MENISNIDEKSENDRTAKTNRFLLTAFPLGHMVNDWPGSALWLLAPAIAVSMGLGPVEVGLLITIHGAGAALAYLPAGLIGDYFRDRGILLTITFWWVAIGYFLAASVTDFWLLALALGVAGLADAAWHPIATGVMVEQMPKQRARVLGLHAFGGTLAEVGAPVTAGFLLTFFDWQTVLQISTIPAFIMAFVFLRYRHRVPKSKESSLTKQDIGLMIKVWIQPGNFTHCWNHRVLQHGINGCTGHDAALCADNTRFAPRKIRAYVCSHLGDWRHCTATSRSLFGHYR